MSEAKDLRPDIGTYYDLAEAEAARHEASLSFLNYAGDDVEAWRVQARAKVHELLAYTPPACPLDARTLSQREENGVLTETISYQQPYGPRTEGFFLWPAKAKGRLPVVLALHDHGGFKYFGKEKNTAIPNEHESLQRHKQGYYGGRSWGTELARRGFAVLSIDIFPFGSRKVAVDSLPDHQQARFAGLEPGAKDYIDAYNAFAGEHEQMLAKTLFVAGTTWPGIFIYEDRRSMDYLLTRPEVDPERIGCGGLSGGGLRTIFLAGLEDRIRCGVCVGFMSTHREFLYDHLGSHTWMIWAPHLSRYLDLPDVIALRAPAPLMVQCTEQDRLFTPKGMHAASDKIAAIYAKMGRPERYRGCFYPGPHKFDVEMQEEAFAWWEKWLK